MLQYIK